MKDTRRKKSMKIQSGKLGLALGSGSSRGWAHIGVIRALEEAGLHVNFVAGTSIGALVGAVYASGGIDELEDIVLRLDWKKITYFVDMVLPKSGLIDGKKISAFVQSHTKGVTIEELQIPFCAVATDLYTGSEVAIKQGDIIEAVRASISVPGIFTPVRKNDGILVDGGLVNPVPVDIVRQMGADFVIAVDLNREMVGRKRLGNISFQETSNLHFIKKRKRKRTVNKILESLSDKISSVDLSALTQIKQWKGKEPLPSIFEVLISSINIMERQITATKLKINPPDLLIQPSLGHINFLEFNRAKEAISQGYEETKLKLDTLFSEQ